MYYRRRGNDIQVTYDYETFGCKYSHIKYIYTSMYPDLRSVQSGRGNVGFVNERSSMSEVTHAAGHQCHKSLIPLVTRAPRSPMHRVTHMPQVTNALGHSCPRSAVHKVTRS